MRIILISVGSSGDVLPMVAIGAELHHRGHDVHIFASPYFQQEIEAAGLTLVPLGTIDDYLQGIRDPRLWRPTTGFSYIASKFIAPNIRKLYEQVESLIIPGRTVAAGPVLAIGARLAHDGLGLPLATVTLQPCVFRSFVDPAYFGIPLPRWKPIVRAFFWVANELVIDRCLRGPINRERRRLGLHPIRHVEPWWHSPQCAIGLFPEWFAPHPPDWPPQTVLTGFPLADGGDTQPLDRRLDDWLDAGDPPIVFTFGSAMMHARKLFAACIDACQSLNRRGLLLTRFTDQLPANLPDTIAHFEYAPFRSLFPRVAALVHQGGIGNTSQALAAGKPQLIIPFTHDQPDNAKRVERLNAGLTLAQPRASARAIAGRLHKLLTNPTYTNAAQACAAKLQHPERDIARACDLVESLVDQ